VPDWSQNQGKLSLAKKIDLLPKLANITHLANQMFGKKILSYLLNL